MEHVTISCQTGPRRLARWVRARRREADGKSPQRLEYFETDVLVIGGGTAGPLAAYKAKTANPALKVVLLEKANVKRSGAIAIGMDGLNNAVVPGFATPEQYVREITIANDGIVYQKAILAYATRSFDMIRELDRWGVKFLKDENGDYDVKKVHHLGAYVLPMPEGASVKKILYRQMRQAQVLISNRFMATRLLRAPDGPNRRRHRRQQPYGGYSHHSRQGRDPGGGSGWTARFAGVRLSLGDLRESDQFRRRPRHGLSRRRRTH